MFKWVKLFSRSLVLGLFFIFLSSSFLLAENKETETMEPVESFQLKIVAEGFNAPWAMVWGPENKIWLTERLGKNVVELEPQTGEKTVLLTIDEVEAEGQHKGLLGLVLGPDFFVENGAQDLYLTYTYLAEDLQETKAKIVKYTYDSESKKLINPVIIIEKLPAGSDHNGGRLIVGPDKMLYLTKGELGHNQFSLICKEIEAQRLPTAEEVAAKNWVSYVGKVLRLTLTGEIPEDNPIIEGVKSHVFTYGHRNPQGLVFVENNLFSVEHGPSTDDELNLLVKGGNYGWPNVAGYIDDQAYSYVNWSDLEDCENVSKEGDIPANVPQTKESEANLKNFKEPLKTFFTVSKNYNFTNENCLGGNAYLCWPTVAPSSVAYYPADGPIKEWRNSLVISTLKTGSVYNLPLHSDKNNIQGDVIKHFKTDNRYRQVLISPNGKIIYIATDNSGGAMDSFGQPASKIENPGSVLAFEVVSK